MTENEKYFIGLLSCHINNYDSPPRIDGIDWQDIFDLSKYHNVCSIITNEIKRLDADYQPSTDVLAQFDTAYNEEIECNKKLVADIALIIDALTKTEIHHLMINGIVINSLYKMPEIANYNDTTFVVKETDFQKTIEEIINLGFEKTNEQQKSVRLEKNKVVIYVKCELDALNVQSKIYFSDFVGEITDVQGYTHKLKPHYELLFAMTTLLSHLKLGDTTAKMLCDIDIILRTHNEIDIDLFYEFCNKIKISKSAEVIFNLCKKWFNSPIKATFDFEDDRHLYNLLTASIIRETTFGMTKESPVSALSHLNKKDSVSEKRGFFSKIKRADKKVSVFSSDKVSERLSGMIEELYA